jgi:hypothetical protein
VHTRFFWDLSPTADFNNQISWTQLDKHRFAATRVRILWVQAETAYDFHGPELDTATISSATTARKFTYKRESIVSSSSTISDTIRKAVTDRVLNQITSKISSGIKATLPVGKVQLGSELVAEEVHEVTRTSEETLSQVTSYSVQSTEGESVEINVGFKEGRTIAELRRRYKQVTWDFYIYSCDYLELEYDPGWFCQRIKRSIQTSTSTSVGSPLARVIFYVPQMYPDVVWRGDDINTVDPADSIEVVTLSELMPKPSIVPPLEALTSYVPFAFPANKKEKKAAAAKKAARKAVKRAPAKKAAARKAPVRKAAARKAPARKAAAKKAVKKAAKKAARRSAR